MSTLTQEIDLALKAVQTKEAPEEDNLELENLTLSILTSFADDIQEKSKAEMDELKERQKDVRFLHNLLKLVNTASNEEGDLDISDNQEIKDLLAQAQELGVEVDLNKTTYNKDERNRLIENIKMTCEDLNMQNDMQMQTINRLTNERYELYQMAKSIIKTLHDAMMGHVRGIGK